ncbi:hypothetical protein TNCV_4212901 [Trichonephila clavipes]|nr:hypothetical protein TNCV_4212901 [Trichonephila clavipes]
MVLQVNDRRTSCPCHDEFRGPRSDYVRQVCFDSGQRGMEKLDSQKERWKLKSSLAEIVEVEIEVVSPSIVPSGSFTELKSHCHLYGAQGQRQVYLLPMPR